MTLFPEETAYFLEETAYFLREMAFFRRKSPYFPEKSTDIRRITAFSCQVEPFVSQLGGSWASSRLKPSSR